MFLRGTIAEPVYGDPGNFTERPTGEYIGDNNANAAPGSDTGHDKGHYHGDVITYGGGGANSGGPANIQTANAGTGNYIPAGNSPGTLAQASPCAMTVVWFIRIK